MQVAVIWNDDHPYWNIYCNKWIQYYALRHVPTLQTTHLKQLHEEIRDFKERQELNAGDDRENVIDVGLNELYRNDMMYDEIV